MVHILLSPVMARRAKGEVHGMGFVHNGQEGWDLTGTKDVIGSVWV